MWQQISDLENKLIVRRRELANGRQSYSSNSPVGQIDRDLATLRYLRINLWNLRDTGN